ncbi:hypothetical protein HRbin17_01125 [bacterium HR17]|uniref:DNA-directed DNA polymerase n=1 Tax=Candidatus Fervidibacter japonicus TaxID=2035412 RepID=A0A2H5XBP1_9BACT|nr:hypothetical protein HRbin17_01125 [bacterium HR17]
MPYLLLPREAQSFRNVRKALTKLYQRARSGQMEQTVIVVFGDDEFLVQRVVQRLTELLLPPAERMETLTVLDGKEATEEQLVEALLVPSFGFEHLKRRLVVVKSPPLVWGTASAKRKGNGEWWQWLRNVPENTWVVLAIPETVPPSVLNVLDEVALLVPIAKLRSQDLPEFVQMLAEQAGVHLTKDAAQELIERVGNDARQLANEVEKLALIVGMDGRVTADVVREAVPSLAMDVFALVNAITAGDTPTAVRLLEGLLERREQPVRIIGMLARQFRFLLQARLLLDAKVITAAFLHTRYDTLRQQLERVPEVLRQRLPNDTRYNLLRQSPAAVRNFLLQARAFSAEQIRHALRLLLEADIGLKTGVDQRQQLMLLVVHLCNFIRASANSVA